MLKHRILFPLILITILSIGGLIITSCASGVLADSQGGLDAQINTAVAATLVQYIIETKVAAQTTVIVSEPVALVLPTSTPLPTAAPVVTEVVVQPTVEPTQAPVVAAAVATFPKIYAEKNTNCRLGPSTRYSIAGYFIAGSTSTVQGRDTTRDWWYIEHPTKDGQFCWVWDGSTMVEGDTSKLPLIDTPALSTAKTSNIFNDYYGYDPYNGIYNPYGNYPYNCWNNAYCGNYPNNCWNKANCGKYPNCYNNTQICIPINWGNCNKTINWTCNLVVKNPCKQSSCPPVTEVNYLKYCTKYPNCCK